ncbi:pyridoxal phosphate-dependent decarboxylase family protein [Wenzhouxiangella marina]|uniref:Aromatic-L-amino-acid decarboxylase n=1 Tax=Wenzhouxiangella marina TaxID=1579979 RepID=A0A0K0XS35_9GAMM|nr:aminotransferase class I/II-fold pyridoxal phosphate-dependent enzyme [Wenzhouxiangella marina]AKS40432.1 Aromatic-L-amino-acid decarboxylase [Wenzhouxiangella marina]MBB6088246.1 glutamate/tyrosine decarboxylase-like PLP-dependent enzyme [Wenzhouxiangella marina]
MVSDELIGRLGELEAQARQLDPRPDQRRRDGQQALAHAEAFLEALDDAPAYVHRDGRAAGLLEQPIAEQGIGLERALGLLDAHVDHEGITTASGRFGGYIPGGGLFHSALGDFLAAITNRYSGVFFASPGAVRLENQLVRWMAELVGLPEGSAGALSSGGSIANLSAIVAARDAHGIEGERIEKAVIYLTEHTHHCVDKALHLAGLGRIVQRRIAVDGNHRLRAEALCEQIERDRAEGLEPWMVLASAGTTNTGSVDPLEAIASIAGEQGLWFHVDAAYGGFFLLTEAGRQRMRGIERADSVVMDPHKTLFLPYGCGVVLVRDGERLRASHSGQADYLQDTMIAMDEASPADLSPELTRHFRGLRLWLPLQVLGLAPFRAALEEKLLLARYFRQRMIEGGRFEVGPEPDLSVVTFRLPEGDAANQALMNALLDDGRVFLSSTRLDGRYTLRLAAVCHRTHRRDVDEMVDVLHRLAAGS